jgi:beta-mannosidase
MLDYFHTADCTDYQTYLEQFVGRFISEEVSFGAASRSSLLKFMTEDDLLRDESEAMWLYHTKGNDALPREIFHDMRSFAQKILGTPADGEDRFFHYKYLQYEWMRQAFGNVRASLGYCNGEIYWMFNDCWPAAAGWSIVDYYCLPKAAYYCFKRCAAPLIGVLKPKGEHTCLTVSNRGTEPMTFQATARLLSPKDGSVLDTHTLFGEAEAYSVSHYDLPWAESEETLIVCDLTYDGGNDRCFHKKGTLPLTPCDERLTVVARTDASVTLRADSYVHAVELEGQFIFDDNYFSLMEGETRTVAFRSWNNPDGTDFTVKGYTLAERRIL